MSKKYGDALDRLPGDGLSRRQFLAAGGQRAARAAWLLLPGATTPLIPAEPETPSDDSAERPERRER